jgi:iron complex transport system permease protein
MPARNARVPTLVPGSGAPAVRGRDPAGALLALGAGVAVLAVVGLAVGSRAVPPLQALQSVIAPDGSAEHAIVRELRVPRTLLGLVVGAALGLAGAVMQGLTRNPLADPGILGVNAGAAAAVVVAGRLLDLGRGTVIVALVGAAAAGAAVYLLGGRGPDGGAPLRLTLAGAAVTAMLGALTTTVLLLDRAALDEFRFWVVGSLAGRPLGTLAPVVPVAVAGGVGAILAARSLDALDLGESTARALGTHPGRARALAAAAVVLLVGAAVAVAGPIAFVSLVAPHLARPLVGAGHRALLAASALTGAALLLTGDIAGRVVARPGEVPVGIMTALIGAPVFVALVRRRPGGAR